MGSLTFTIASNCIGRLTGHDTLCLEDAGTSARWASLDKALDWICGTQRAGAIKALEVLKLAKEAESNGGGKKMSDRETLKAYFTLKGLVTKAHQSNFSEDLSAGRVSIAGLDSKGPVEFSVSHAELEKQEKMVSGWGKIADHFDDDHKEAARSAFERLALADTVECQLRAYADLHRNVRAESQAELTWAIPVEGVSVFRLGSVDIPCCTETAGLAADFNLESTCRLLYSMHYAGMRVVAEFHGFGAPDVTPGVTTGGADSVIYSQIGFLHKTPKLADALKLLGLHEHDDEGAYAATLGIGVAWIAGQTVKGEQNVDDFASQCARSAMNLRISIKEVSLDHHYDLIGDTVILRPKAQN